MACRESAANWQAHHAQILKEHGFVPSLSGHLERDIRRSFTLTVSWWRCPLTKNDGSKASFSRRQHCDGSFVLEPCDEGGIPHLAGLSWWLTTRHVTMVLRDLGLEKPTPVVAAVAKRPKAEELLTVAGGQLNGEDYQPVQVGHDARELHCLSLGPSRLVIRWKLSGTRDEEGHNEKPSRNSKVLDASCEGDQLERSCLNHKHCLVFWRCCAMQTVLGTFGTRKSCSEETAVMRRSHLIKHGSAVQSTMAVSSGESEYYAFLRFFSPCTWDRSNAE